MQPPRPHDRYAFFAWYETEHNELHRAWSADVGRPFYNKERWLERERALNNRAWDYANELGVKPPFLRPPNRRDSDD